MSEGEKKATREKVKLTERLVKGLKGEAKNYSVWDSEYQGLGVQVSPSGAKAYVFKYSFAMKQRWVTVGHHPEMSLEEAQKKVRGFRVSLDNQVDPSSLIKANKTNPLVSELAVKFTEEHLSKRKKRTQDDYADMLKKYVLKPLGRLQVKDVNASHISTIHVDMKDKPIRANRVLAMLSSMFACAETWGFRKPGTNPCKAIERYPETARTRYLKPEEIKRLLRVLQEQEATFPEHVRLFLLLLLTGARLREVLNCRWSAEKGDPIHPYLDREGGRIVCVDHKGSRKQGPKDIILSAQALFLIDGLDKRLGSPYLFPSSKKPMEPMGNPHHVWLTVRARPERGQKERLGIRDLAGLPDLRLHDLRHSFGTLSVTLNQNPTIRQRLLGHASMATTERYSHADLDPLRAAVEQIGEAIGKLQRA